MFTGVIIARGGSMRLKDKNIRPFGDSNLLVHKIRQLKQVPSIDRVFVSSDSDVMLEMAKKEGASTHKRAPEYCDEKSKTFGEAIRNVCENVEGEHIVWALCTLPLILPKHYQGMVDAYLAHKDTHDSVLAGTPFNQYLFDEDGPVNFQLGTKAAPSQNLPKWHLVFGASVASRQNMIDWYHHIGQKPFLYALPKISAIDIDDPLDMEVAQAWHPMVGDHT